MVLRFMIVSRKRHMTAPEKQRAKELRRGDLSYQAIADILRDASLDKREFDRATILRTCSSMPDLPVDEPFQWRNIQDYGLPWESSAYILDFWAQAIEFLGNIQQDPDLLDLPAGFRELPSTRIYTGRHVRWWWRVHQADPDLRIDAVLALASAFRSREYRHEVLGLPLELADLQGLLAYRPWHSEHNCEIYLGAVSEGRIPPLNEIDLNNPETLATFKRIPSDGESLLLILTRIKN